MTTHCRYCTNVLCAGCQVKQLQTITDRNPYFSNSIFTIANGPVKSKDKKPFFKGYVPNFYFKKADIK